MFKPLSLLLCALLALAPALHAEPKKATAAKASSYTAKAMPPKAPLMSPKDIGMLDAVRLGVGKVEKATVLNRSAFPEVSTYQDPRSIVKVPSPDGKKLIWRGLDKKGYCLFLSDANGKGEKRLDACHNGFEPSWSPDGKKVLFRAMDWRIEAFNLFLYDMATAKVQRAFNAKKKVGALASFSPDGKKILFNYFDDLWLMNSNGIGRSLLNVSGKIEKPIGDAEQIAWSKDGSAFCYQMRGDSTIYVVTLAPKI